MSKPVVVLGLLGINLDSARPDEDRWNRWRPTVSLCQHDDLLIRRVELLHPNRSTGTARVVAKDLRAVSPETHVRRHVLDWRDPWDFQEVFGALHEFARSYDFDPDHEDYLVHITTGTHVAQICLFLLTESRHFPGRLVQTSPPKRFRGGEVGRYQIIDLDLSRYDRIAMRFRDEQREASSFLKSGIETRSAAFNALIDRIEHVAIASEAPMLLTGPTGAGKSQLARRIYELKHARRQVDGPFVDVNCATLRGDAAMSTLFGHVKGAFTGATSDRSGLLVSARDGVLFLDEIGELGLDEQAMLLRAIEEKRFFPVGSDREIESDFQLIAGTNRDLRVEVGRGTFREDLLARIDLWTFELPGLRDRREDIEPNLTYELEQFARNTGRQIRFNREARDRFLGFATSDAASWNSNFRDLNAALTRMATLAPAGRIRREVVDEEIERLRHAWKRPDATTQRSDADGFLVEVIGAEAADRLDRFDRVQLADVLDVVRRTSSLSEAGRILFAQSRERRATRNDADRLRKYLAKFDIRHEDIKRARLDASSPGAPT